MLDNSYFFNIRFFGFGHCTVVRQENILFLRRYILNIWWGEGHDAYNLLSVAQQKNKVKNKK